MDDKLLGSGLEGTAPLISLYQPSAADEVVQGKLVRVLGGVRMQISTRG